jgi:hypothetical protein
MNTKRTFFIVILIFLCNFFAVAQASKEANKPKTTSSSSVKNNPLGRIKIGGALNGGISNDYYFFTAAPRVSMEVTKWFVPGVTVSYMYSQETGINRVSTNTYGAGVFTDFYPIQYVFGHVEYQHLWYNQKVKGIPQKLTMNDHFLLMGAGVKMPIGNKMSAFASVLFNVLNNENSEYYMYKNPIYGVGIEVGL